MAEKLKEVFHKKGYTFFLESPTNQQFIILENEKMKELIFDKNRTVMIVSHNPDTVRQLCTSVLWIHEGKVRMQGDVETVLEAYEGET